jgi:TonB-linked SusC/RagA family outer membrane protein
MEKFELFRISKLFGIRKKWLIAMKTLILLVCVFSIQLNASVLSQQTVSLNMSNVSAKELIREIEAQTNLGFIYNLREIEKLDGISIEAEEQTVKEVLDQVLENTDLTYELEKSVIIIMPKPAEPAENNIQQKKSIKGKVTDDQGIPLPGVSVVIKGTNIGVATDIDGNYSLELEQENVVLVFSFVGMLPQEIRYNGQNTLNVTLSADSEQMAEVVVTGYQTLSKERATGSFSLLDNEVFEERITTNLTESLDGMVAGLYVDGDNEITIRGTGTLYGDSKPLIVVDGFPVEADLSTINPDDIKSVSVLKDAAATSIWGVKAANGVIVVSTKMGQKGKAKVNASYYLTIEEKPSFSDLNLATTAEAIDYELTTYEAGQWDPSWVSFYPQRAMNPLQRAYYDRSTGTLNEQQYEARIAELKGVNAYKQMEDRFLQNAVSHQLNVSLSGAGEKSKYYASVVYNKNGSTSVGNSSDRINANFKNEYKLSDKFTLSTGANFTISKSENNGLSVGDIFRTPGYQALVDENGDPIQYYMVVEEKGKELEDKGYLSYTTSLLDVYKHNDNTTKGFDARLQVGLNYKILPGLDIDTKFQYERGYSKSNDFKSVKHPETRRMINTYTKENANGDLEYGVPKGGWLKAGKNDHEAWTWRNQLSYNASFDDDKHQVSVIGGTEVRKYVTYGFSDEKFGYDPKTLKYMSMSEEAWLSSMQNNGAWYGRTGMAYGEFTKFSEVDNRDISVFMNGSYTYNRKYTINASGRVDQSNLFGSSKEFRYKPLWSAGLSWKISDEDFMSEVQWLDNLMLRTTYGVGGSTNKNFYPALMGAYGTSFWTGDAYIRLTNPANDQLKWESSYMLNFGIDWSILSNRIWGSIDVYNKDSKDIIGRQSMDATYGWDAANVNFASINNKGLEIAFNAIPLKKNGFKWETNLNFAHNKNEVVEVGIVGATLSNYLNTLAPYEYVDMYAQYGMLGYLGIPIKGKPLSRLYAYKYGGLDGNGEPMIYDENNELISWNAYSGNPDALKYMGTSTPTVFGNLRNSFSYKGLTLAVNLTYKFGHVFRAPRATAPQVFTGGAYLKDIAERWQKPGDEEFTDVPKYSRWNAYYMNGYYKNADINVLKGDLVRLKDLSLDYNLPKGIIAKTPFASLNVKFQAKNLWLWTANDEDIDPDKAGAGGYGYAFPTAKSFVFGVKATF